jgi:hypothetical protein
MTAGEPARSGRVVYLNVRQAEAGRVRDRALPRAYRDLCRFMHCGVIDRSGTIAPPFDWTVLDPVPAVAGAVRGELDEMRSFSRLCDARGVEIVAEAEAGDRTIQVLWSGGIDSTAALIGVMKAAETAGCAARVQVLLSMDSVLEYPEFYLDAIDRRYAVQPVGQPMSRALDPAALNLTGEHGDQLFGSQLLAPYVRRGVAEADWRDLLPLVMLERLRDPRAARRAWKLAQPVLEAAPIGIRSLFDALWWLNFTLKWQDVSVRMVATRGADAPRLAGSLQHFFRTEPFQQWALWHTPGRPVERWIDYKLPAKTYVRDFTGDERYFRQKTKEDSLRNVLIARNSTVRSQIFMRDDFVPVVTAVELPAPGRIRRLLSRELAPRGPRMPEYGG